MSNTDDTFMGAMRLLSKGWLLTYRLDRYRTNAIRLERPGHVYPKVRLPPSVFRRLEGNGLIRLVSTEGLKGTFRLEPGQATVVYMRGDQPQLNVEVEGPGAVEIDWEWGGTEQSAGKGNRLEMMSAGSTKRILYGKSQVKFANRSVAWARINLVARDGASGLAVVPDEPGVEERNTKN